VGAILHDRLILARDMTATYLAANCADATQYTDHFDDEPVWSVRKMSNVTAVAGKRSISAGHRGRAGIDVDHEHQCVVRLIWQRKNNHANKRTGTSM